MYNDYMDIYNFQFLILGYSNPKGFPARACFGLSIPHFRIRCARWVGVVGGVLSIPHFRILFKGLWQTIEGELFFQFLILGYQL